MLKSTRLCALLVVLATSVSADDDVTPVVEDPVLQGDPVAGERIFKRCKACHTLGEGAKNRAGPVLNGIIGATAGSVEGFRYSKAMLKAGEEGLVWDVENLTSFLENPKGFLKGSKMAFGGLKKPEDLSNLLTYIAQFE